MKIKKVVSGVLVLAALVTSVVAASAASTIEEKTVDWDMGKAYSKTTSNKTGYMYYYVGSWLPYDDVFAYSETKVTSGMTGYAIVTLKAQNGTVITKSSSKITNNSYIRTDYAEVSGQDVAERVQFIGARKDNGQDYVGFSYNIY